jgi:hypothetical protein
LVSGQIKPTSVSPEWPNVLAKRGRDDIRKDSPEAHWTRRSAMERARSETYSTQMAIVKTTISNQHIYPLRVIDQ